MALTDVNSTLKNIVTNISQLVTGFNNFVTAIVTQFQNIETQLQGILPPRGYIDGFILSNDATLSVLDIAAGTCTDSTGMFLITGTAFTKSITGPWVAGSNQTGMGDGLTFTDDTWYHVFAIINAGAYDIYFDSDIGAGNAPAGTTAFRRIGSIEGEGDLIFEFLQVGNYVFWQFPVLDADDINLVSNFTSIVVSTPPDVVCFALCQISEFNDDPNTGDSDNIVMISPDLQSVFDSDPIFVGWISPPGQGFDYMRGWMPIPTDTNSTIVIVSSNLDPTNGTDTWVNTYGYIDQRGQNS